MLLCEQQAVLREENKFKGWGAHFTCFWHCSSETFKPFESI